MAYLDPAEYAKYQKAYKLKNKEYFATYRAGKGDYFLEKKREWAKKNPSKSAEYGKRYRLWKGAVTELSKIDISDL